MSHATHISNPDFKSQKGVELGHIMLPLTININHVESNGTIGFRFELASELDRLRSRCPNCLKLVKWKIRMFNVALQPLPG